MRRRSFLIGLGTFLTAPYVAKVEASIEYHVVAGIYAGLTVSNAG